jgi:pimeloyl-ACP methyl ester carboxylesterase
VTCPEEPGDSKRNGGARVFPTQPKGLLVRTTIVLVHGAFAESASWDGVIEPLVAEGHRVVAAPNPLRGLYISADSFHDVFCQLIHSR